MNTYVVNDKYTHKLKLTSHTVEYVAG